MEKQVVVVGVDGSDEARRAVRWAAEEAARRDAALHVVHAWVWPLYKVPLGPAPGAPAGAGLQAQADRVLADAADEASAAAPGVPVETSLRVGDAAALLIAESREAALLVLGHRGLGGFAGLLLGSVGIAAASHAPCPVAVVRGRADATGPVVVGVDGPERSRPTIDAAFAAARRRGVAVVALHSFLVPPRHRGFAERVAATSSPVESYRAPLTVAQEGARTMVECELAGAREAYPEVAVTVQLCDESAGKDLVAASRDAGLVVVGARGSGGFAGLVIGSTTHALIHHAECPVLVARGAAGEVTPTPSG